VRGWTHLPVPHYHRERIDFYSSPESNGLTWRQLFETPLPFAGVVKYWQELIDECENAYTLAGGFAIETNYFFRSIKWQRLGYVRAQNAVWKNTGLPFYYWRGAMLEDFVRTVDVVSRCNQVLINRFIKPQKTFFEEGGIGPFEDRRPKLVACCNNLLSRYPGLLRPVKEQDYSLTFVPKSPSGVAKWRQQRDQAQ